MEIVKSQKFTPQEVAIIDNAVGAVFNAHNQPQDTYFPNVSLFISSDASEHPNYLININNLLGDARSKMTELLKLSNYIFRGAYVEPRYILAAYEQPHIPTIVSEPIIAKTETIEEKVEELKHEVADLEKQVTTHDVTNSTEAPATEVSVEAS
jgi:hypothetical protein